MSTPTVVRARIDPELKERATAALSKMGLSVSDAIRMLLVRVAAEKAMPFEIRLPNERTQEAMREAREGKLERFDTLEALMTDLNEKADA